MCTILSKREQALVELQEDDMTKEESRLSVWCFVLVDDGEECVTMVVEEKVRKRLFRKCGGKGEMAKKTVKMHFLKMFMLLFYVNRKNKDSQRISLKRSVTMAILETNPTFWCKRLLLLQLTVKDMCPDPSYWHFTRPWFQPLWQRSWRSETFFTFSLAQSTN